MSDLAPFVAAALRDKVVTELVEENNRLKRKADQLEKDIANGGHTMLITGTTNKNGKQGQVVFVRAKIDEDGFETVDHASRWIVDLTMEPGVVCHYSQIDETLEMSLWGTSKKLIVRENEDEGVCFMDYDSDTRALDVTFLVAPKFTILHGQISPVSPELVEKLRDDHDGCSLHGFRSAVDQVLEELTEEGNGENIMVEFTQVKFNSQAHTLWNMTNGEWPMALYD